MRPIYFNGKFYTGVLNGVHRVADRLLREVDKLAEETRLDAHHHLRVLTPERANWAPAFKVLRKVPQRHGHNQLWEQLLLPLKAGDGVLVNLANLAPILHPRKLSMIHDAQFVISPESFPPRLRIGYRLLTPIIARSSAKVLTVSEYSRESLAAFKIADHDRIKVIYNGADHILEVESDRSVISRLGLEGSPHVLLFGTTAVYKNIQVVLKAFDRPELTGVVLVVVGTDEKRLARAGLRPPPSARFAGAVNDAELRALYETALCLVFPSRTEGFGLPPLEAMACGCPVVLAPAGAMPEVCRDAASYADVFDPASWAREILRLQANPALRQTKIESGRNRAGEFTWRRAALQLVDEAVRLART